MGSGLSARLAAEIETLEARGLRRRRSVLEGAAGPVRRLDGREFLTFCSNDYLGLAAHPEVTAAFEHAARTWGVGSGAAHLVTGHTREHHALEEELAEFTGRSRALLFSTGYMANIGIAQALLDRGDWLFEDRLNHASMIDAARVSRARMLRYRHADADALEQRLAQVEGGHRLVMTDAVFSMDGDLAPLPDLVAVCGRHEAWLMIDDAHGLGVLGEGRGSAAHFGLGPDQVPILMGTLGKALGGFGAFVAGDEALIEYLIQRARTYIYTTAPPPAVAAAVRAALNVCRREHWRRDHLADLIRRFRAGAGALGLELPESDTPIQPLVVGSPERAMRLGELLLKRGILVTPIRPPTVPEGTSRLRVTLSAAHTEADIGRLLDALGEALQEETGES